MSTAEPKFPDVEVHLSTGHDGNVGAIMGTVRDAMKQAGVPDYGQEMSAMWSEVFDSGSYTETLAIVMRWVHVT